MSTQKKPTEPSTIIPSIPQNKPKRLTTNNNNNQIKSPCCGMIRNFLKQVMENFVIPSFALNIIGCIMMTYYLNCYIQTNKSYLPITSYLILTLCAIPAIIFHSYSYLVIVLLLSPHGEDSNSYSVGIGRGRFDPYRVYLFICTCFREFATLRYANSYFFRISRYLNQCKRISPACDLNKMPYNHYSVNSLKRIICNANNQCLESIENQQRLERNFLKQAHYDNIVKQDVNRIIKLSQTKARHMISLFNVHFDEKNAKQYANIFLPPFASLTMSTPTPAIIFLVGGAWGSCDISFSAAAASSFVHSKIAFIYPKYTVYPDGNVQDMLSNIAAVIKWSITYSSALNINPNHICIVGQSSGAHLSALAILKAYQEKSKWLRRVRLYCGLSGPYCIRDHYAWESNRGIENVSPMARCMKGIANFGFYSPSVIIQELYTAITAKYINDVDKTESELKQMSELLPYFLLIHSVNDCIVPISSSRKFKQRLDKIKVKCELEQYQNGTHYDTLFGLCDVNNCLFNRLITDITSRIFLCCKQYNECMQLLQKQEEEKVDEIGNADIYNLADIEEEEEDDDDSYDSGFDVAQNEENETNNDVKEENIHQQCSNDEDKNNKTKLKDIIGKEIESKRAGIAADLFRYDDVSMDVNKSDEAIEMMKNLLSDMDKALNQISSLNNNTIGQIDEIDEIDKQ